MGESAITVKNLTRRFGDFTAVNNINFEVEKGEIFGFLGANGAGKSTTIRMLCGILSSTSGTAEVGGYDINEEPEMVKKHIGYMSQKFSLYEDLTAAQNIEFYAGVYGLENSHFDERYRWVIDMAGLSGREHSLTGELPGGWKQRLALGCAILHEPEIVFLDEPTGGVDPISRRGFWDLINDLSDKGHTIFVTTHYLDEAEYCNTIMLIHAGNIVAGGSPQELKTDYIEYSMYELECDNVIDAMESLRTKNWVEDVSVFGTSLHIGTNEEEAERKVREELSDAGIEVRRFERIIPSLEDVFVHLVQEDKRISR
ncbi:MAG: ATP-binding cassette domain-containing protein [candidate division Zixibacteria bacterium]|nr:ATP-binding cassette domain-containing protein [candidate division Zixibacteria bacterium]